MKPAFVVIVRLAVRRELAPHRHSRQRLRPHPARHRRGAARRRARLRPDHADRHRLGRAVLHGRPAVALDRRRSALPASAASSPPTRCCPHVAGRIDRFLAPQTGDTFQVDTALRFDHARRLARPRAGRGHGEAHPARRPHRLHLRRRGGGVRHHRLHRPGAGLRLRRDPRAVAQRCGARTPSSGSPPPAWSCSSACSRSSTWRSIST